MSNEDNKRKDLRLILTWTQNAQTQLKSFTSIRGHIKMHKSPQWDIVVAQ